MPFNSRRFNQTLARSAYTHIVRMALQYHRNSALRYAPNGRVRAYARAKRMFKLGYRRYYRGRFRR